MKDINLLLTAISVLWFLTTGLIVYIFKDKDSKIKEISNNLNEIKTLINSVNLTLNSVKIELDNNIYQTRKLDEAMIKQIDITTALKIAETKLSGRVFNIEKELKDLKETKNK